MPYKNKDDAKNRWKRYYSNNAEELRSKRRERYANRSKKKILKNIQDNGLF